MFRVGETVDSPDWTSVDSQHLVFFWHLVWQERSTCPNGPQCLVGVETLSVGDERRLLQSLKTMTAQLLTLVSALGANALCTFGRPM